MWASLMSRKYRFIQILLIILACISLYLLIPKEHSMYFWYFIMCVIFFRIELKEELLNSKQMIFSIIRIVLAWTIFVILAKW